MALSQKRFLPTLLTGCFVVHAFLMDIYKEMNRKRMQEKQSVRSTQRMHKLLD